MIVPRNRLLFWVAAIVLPFSYLAAVVPTALLFSLAAIVALIVLAVADAWRTRATLRGLTVQLPEVVRMSKDRQAKLEVRVRNQPPRSLRVRLALALPREIPSENEEVTIALPAASEWSRLNWPCRPLKRGDYQVECAAIECASPLGFWSARKAAPIDSKIRVYPNLFADRRDLAALFLHRGVAGVHAHRQVGKGREFEKLREYVPGDSFEEIHWKATARRGRPITKVFQIERTQEVYVVIDASRLSARPTARLQVEGCRSKVAGLHVAQGLTTLDSASCAVANRGGDMSSLTPPLSPSEGEAPAESTLERFLTAALMLGLAAEQQGDLFGLLTFTNRVENFVRARNGKTHYSACRDALYTLQPKVVSPDFDEVCSFIRLRLRRRALLVFLTVLDDPVLAESFVRNLDLIRRQHLVLVNMIQPLGVGPLFSDPNVASSDDLYEQLGGHLRWQNLRELEKVLQRRGVRFSLLKNERLSAELVSQYLNVKRRQAL